MNRGANTDEYVKELKENYAMPESEAFSLSKDPRSFMAVGIKGEGKEPIGVVFLDSKEVDFFGDVVVQSAVVIACCGLTEGKARK